METAAENESSCKNIFLHDKAELSEAFTQLWIKVINDKENSEIRGEENE